MKPLSRRESEVLDLTRAGLSISAIADELGVARGTVATYRHRILEKKRAGRYVDPSTAGGLTWREIFPDLAAACKAPLT